MNSSEVSQIETREWWYSEKEECAATHCGNLKIVTLGGL